jgi:hypothetical protein
MNDPQLKYLDAIAQQRAKKSDWLIAMAALHSQLDQAGVANGDGGGAYSLYYRIQLLIVERDNLNAENKHLASLALNGQTDRREMDEAIETARVCNQRYLDARAEYEKRTDDLRNERNEALERVATFEDLFVIARRWVEACTNDVGEIVLCPDHATEMSEVLEHLAKIGNTPKTTTSKNS